MKISRILLTLLTSSALLQNTHTMEYFTSSDLSKKAKDKYYGHGVMILDEIKNNKFVCNPNDVDDIHRCERGIKDLISQKKTDDLVVLLEKFKERDILTGVNGIFLKNANSHIVDSYQEGGHIDKLKSWLNFCKLKKISFDQINATKSKEVLVKAKNKELKNAFTGLQQYVQRVQELVEAIQTTERLEANGPFPDYKDYENIDTIYVLMLREFEKRIVRIEQIQEVPPSQQTHQPQIQQVVPQQLQPQDPLQIQVPQQQHPPIQQQAPQQPQMQQPVIQKQLPPAPQQHVPQQPPVQQQNQQNKN